jgi:hypothetical protein
VTDCIDAGVGSRNRKGNTCAGKMLADQVDGHRICDFHAQMRCFAEALRSVQQASREPEAT